QAAGVELQRERLARTEEVRLHDRARQDHLLGAREADAERDVAGGSLGDGAAQVDLVGCIGDRPGVDLDLGEVAAAVDSRAREPDLLGVVPRVLVLPEFAPDHLVARADVARDVDATHVNPAAGIDEDVEGDLALFAVDLRHGVDVGERVAQRAELLGNPLGRVGQLAAREHVAGLELHQRLEVVLAAEQLAAEADARHPVELALVDVDGDLDAVLLGRNGNLRRLDVELQVAAVEVERAQRLEVTGELLARVLVGLRVPREPGRRGEPHLVEQALGGERLVADEPDRGDSCRIAFLDRQRDADAVAFERSDRRRNADRVLAARQVLALDLLLGALEDRTVEDARLGQPLLAQHALERVGVELLGAADVDRRDRRALLDVDDEHVALGLQANVPEEPGREQRLDRLAGLFVGYPVADPNRQVAEHGPRFGALYAFDPD